MLKRLLTVVCAYLSIANLYGSDIDTIDLYVPLKGAIEDAFNAEKSEWLKDLFAENAIRETRARNRERITIALDSVCIHSAQRSLQINTEHDPRQLTSTLDELHGSRWTFSLDEAMALDSYNISVSLQAQGVLPRKRKASQIFEEPKKKKARKK